jgi:Raf kinase inhibitor-like YbhB/YbcL family protein
MPNPGSHGYDIKRTRLRAEYDDHGVPDQHADQAANEQLQRDHPQRTLGDPDRAAGPAGKRTKPGIDDAPSATAGEVMLRSAAFNDHTMIPDRYSFEKDGISPPLEWTGIPDEAAELVLLCEDPDAPTGTFTHWLVVGIPPEATGVDEGSSPEGGTPCRNDFGEVGWGGPRPPVGDDPHRYFFRLYATDSPSGLGQDATREEVHAFLEEHTLARGNTVGLFGR